MEASLGGARGRSGTQLGQRRLECGSATPQGVCGEGPSVGRGRCPPHVPLPVARVLVRATLPSPTEMAVVKEIVPRIELGELPNSPPPIQASIHMPVYHPDWRWAAGWP